MFPPPHTPSSDFLCLSMSPHTLYSYNFDISESALQHTHSVDDESGLLHRLFTTSLFSPIPLLLLPFAEIVLIPPNWCFCDWTFLLYLSSTISRHIFLNTDVIMSLLTNPWKCGPPMIYTRIYPHFLLKIQIPRPNSATTYWTNRRHPPMRNQ